MGRQWWRLSPPGAANCSSALIICMRPVGSKLSSSRYKIVSIMLVLKFKSNGLQGMCDNLLTSVVRAWDFAKPLLLAPAMNTFMWDSPFTAQQLQVLRSLGAQVVPPVCPHLYPPSAQPRSEISTHCAEDVAPPCIISSWD